MKQPKAPEPPDPQKVASAQTGSNVGTAVANQILGNVNQITPYGTSTHNQTGSTKWSDPVSGKVYDLPQFTNTQTLDPAQQRLHNRQTRAETSLATLAGDQANRLGGILGKPADMSGAPKVAAPRLQGVDYRKTQTGSFGDAGDITKTYGTDFSEDRQRVEDALMARLNPSLERDRSRLESNLSNRGIKLGSGAYDRGVDEFTRQSNDARLGAILGAGEEQSRLTGMEAQRAGFENTAQQQQYNQNLGRQQFMNTARQGNLANMMGVQGFNNQQAQQGFNNQRGLRGDYLQEQYAARNQPINEIAALMGTGQVQNPMFAQGGGTQMPTTDYAGIQMQNYQNQLGAYNANQQRGNPMMGGLFGLANTGLGAFL